MARFIVSHRLAGKKPTAAAASQSALDSSVGLLAKFTNIEQDNRPASETERRVLHIEGDPVDIQSRREEFGSDVLIEPEVLRTPAVALPEAAAAALSLQGEHPPASGIGNLFHTTVLGNGKPLEGAKVTLIFGSRTGAGAGTRLEATVSGDGKLALAYDPTLFFPSLMLIRPLNGVWQGWVNNPQTGTTIDLPALPKSGPVGWWHQVQGMLRDSPDRGAGIKVGVVDTGVGPHPYLDHVQRLGSMINGNLNSAPGETDDGENHGTHVCGIIGARPAQESGDYAGIASGADLMCIRVFPHGGGANQGDIAEAIDHLSQNGADLINLSLGGPQPSGIERDSILAAIEAGTLCVCAAGNAYNQPLYYPAAYPETVSVSALGLLGAAPAGTEAANCVPSRLDHFGPGGLFVANFTNIGAGLVCTAAGVGIISTVPVRNSVAAPYLDMSGTSMASPVTCASLASLLSQDQAYKNLPRNTSRAQRASATLLASVRQLGLNQLYVGCGLSQAWPS